MVKIRGSIMSMDAGGTIAGTVTASSWKGRQYLKRKPTPIQPNTGAQISMREMMRLLTVEWDGLSTAEKATWENYPSADDLPPYNHYLAANLERWGNYLAPSQDSTFFNSQDFPTLSGHTVIGGVRHVKIRGTINNQRKGWFLLWFRSQTGGFTAEQNDLVIAHIITGPGVYTLLDTPLEPGTYFYRLRATTWTGGMKAASSEFSATVS